MAFAEDPTVFLDLNGFGVPVSAGAISSLGIFDCETVEIFNGDAIKIPATITALTSEFGNLGYGSPITVDGNNYLVTSKPEPFDDGVFCRIVLTAAPVVVIALQSRRLRTAAGRPLIAQTGRQLITQPV